MTEEQVNVAILFADINDSTNLYDTRPNVKAKALIDMEMQRLLSHMSVHGGNLVKTIGDEIMCVFHTAEAAARAALAMQARDAREPSDLTIKIGFQWGNTIVKEGDYFGDAVNVAARLVSLSKADTILTTRAVFDNVPPELQLNMTFSRSETIKGKAHKLDLYELTTRPTTVRIDSKNLFPMPAYDMLRLSCNGHDYVLKCGDMPLTIGRLPVNQVAIQEDHISGRHARIEYRGGQFLFIDDSKNGSYLAFDGGRAFEAKPRSTVTLRTSGTLWFGGAPDDPDAVMAKFICGQTDQDQ